MHARGAGLRTARLAAGALVVLAAGLWPQQVVGPARPGGAASGPGSGEGAAASVATAAYGRLPLSFEANAGQADAAARFVARSAAATYAFAPDGVLISPAPPAPARSGVERGHPGAYRPGPAPAAVHLEFLGSSGAPPMDHGRPLPGTVNYLRGSDRKRWITGVPTYRGITYTDLYPGVSIAYEGPVGALKGTYTLAAGVDPAVIRWCYAGAAGVAIDAGGDLEIRSAVTPGAAPAPVLREHAPVAWQEVAGRRRPVAVSFRQEADGSLRFAVGAHDRSRNLVIDPTLTYSTYLGGAGFQGAAVAVDGTGSAYITGGSPSGYVAKLNPSGSALDYTTILDGQMDAIAVDAAGDAYVAGSGFDANFPVVNGLGPCSGNGSSPDGLLVKLDRAGANILYSTCVAGTTGATGVAVDAAGDAYLTGGSTGGLATSVGAFQPVFAGEPTVVIQVLEAIVGIVPLNVVYAILDSVLPFPPPQPPQPSQAPQSSNAYVVKLDTASVGTASLAYSTYLGGEGADAGGGIAIDQSGDAFVTGSTTSLSFPTSGSPAFQASRPGPTSAFVSELNPTGSALVYSTYLGGSGEDHGNAIALNGAGNAYVTGSTISGSNSADDFPIRGAHPFQPSSGGGEDVFVAEVSPGGTGLEYSTYLGGAGDEEGTGIAVDAATGNAYVTGSTTSTQPAPFPVSPSPMQAPPAAPPADRHADAFISEVGADGSSLVYSTYLGGAQDDSAAGVATWTDPSAPHHRYAYLAGTTASPDFPTTPIGPEQGTLNGTTDAFVSRIDDADSPPTIAAAGGSDQSTPVGTGFPAPLRAAARPGSAVPTAGLGVTFTAPSTGASGTFGVLPGCVAGSAVVVTCLTDAGGIATAPPLTANGTPGAYAVVAHLPGASPDAVFALSNAALATLSPATAEFGAQPVGVSSSPHQLTLANSGAAPITITAVAVTPADYAQTNDCGSSLAGGASCTVSVTFTPMAAGARPGTVSVTDSAAGSPHTAALSGSGAAAGTACSATPSPAGTAVAWGITRTGDDGIVGGFFPPRPANVSDPSGLGTLTGVAGLAAGHLHTLARTTDGAVFAFGGNTSGQLGTGSTTGSNVPAPVSGLGRGSGISAIAAGASHSLALRSDGSVLAWGANAAGQLGDGSTSVRTVPVPVSGLGAGSGVIAIAAGGAFSLALRSDGSVLAWGANSNGQLGDGSTSGRTVPVAVSGLGAGSGVIAIAAGGAFSLALRSDGSVLAWGANAGGELGDGNTADSAVPVPVSGLGTGSGVVAVAAGAAFSLAVRSDGSVASWGANAQGQLGDGATGDSDLPVAVTGLGAGGGVSAVAAGDDWALALRSDGSVLGWGNNTSGSLGNGAADGGSTVPVSGPFGPHSGVTAITSHLAIIGQPRGTTTVAAGTGQKVPAGMPLSPLRVTVRDGHDHPVAGAPVTFITTGALGSPVDPQAPNSVLTDSTGVATMRSMVATRQAAAPALYSVIASSPGYGNAILTVTVEPITFTPVAGTPQSALQGTAFPVPMAALVQAGGLPMPGYPVPFSAPGSFVGGGTTVTAFTNAAGVATAPALTAGSTALGATSTTYTGWAGPPAATGSAAFSLTSLTAPMVVTAVAGTPQQAPAGAAFSSLLRAAVSVGSHPVAGQTVVFAAPAAGASATFAPGGTATTTAVTDADGVATATALTANAATGAYSVAARTAGATTDATFSLVNLSRAISAGDPQLTTAGTGFPLPLQALVSNGAGPVRGATVTFSAPSSGAGGSFPGGGVAATAITDAAGIATSPAFTANAQPGAYPVTASVSGAPAGAVLALTNLPAAIGICGGSPQGTPAGAAFGTPLRAVVTDGTNHPVAGDTVSFTAPSAGPTATFPGGAASATAVTNAAGIATAPTLTAGAALGSYTVTATASSAAVSAGYALSNTTAHTLTVTRGGAGSGTVTSQPGGINCGPTCSAGFGAGAGVTLIATPDAGSSFAGWSGSCSGVAACTLTMDVDRTAGATFSVLPDLSPVMSHSPSTLVNGSTGSYTVTVTNVGGAATSGTVTVADTLPAGLTPSAAGGPGWSCTRTGQQVGCNRSDVLAAGTAYPSITVAVAVATGAASLINVVTVSGGGEINTVNDSSTDPTPISHGPAPSPGARLSPAALDFGGQAVGVAGAPQAVTLTNTGTAPLTIAFGGITTSLPDYIQANGCPSALPPGAGCTITVAFTPVATGSRAAVLSVGDSAPGSPQTVSLSGIGLPLLSGDASAIRLSGVTLLGGAVPALPDSGLGVCEAGPVSTASATTVTGAGLPGCQGGTVIPNPVGGPVPLAIAGVMTETVTTGGGLAGAHSSVASLSLLPGLGIGGADVLDVSGLDARSSASCPGGAAGAPTSSSSIAGAVLINGTRVATQPVGSRIIFNPTGKNPTTLYGNPITVNPTGARTPMAIVTLNYSRHDPATNTQVSSPLEVEFPPGGALSSVIVGRVFVSYAAAGAQRCG